MTKSRSMNPSDEGPVIWIEKRAMEKIEKSKHISNKARAKLIYIAVSGIASEEGSTEIVAYPAYIGRLAGMGNRLTWKYLKELNDIGVIKVQQNDIANKQAKHRMKITLIRNEME